jgi:hypothetical protein
MSGSLFVIPTQPSSQTFQVQLGANFLTMTIMWRNAPDCGYVLDILDGNTGTPIVCGIPLVTGCDLLGQYAYLGLGGSLFVLTSGDPYAMPGYADLGVISFLYWYQPS